MKKASWFLFFLILAVSCLDEPDCFRLSNNAIGITFKILGVGTDNVSMLELKSTDSDSVFYAEKSGSSFVVPLNLLKTSTTYNLKFYTTGSALQQHSLTVGYDRQVQYVSEDCGERHIYSNLKVLEYTFDSLREVSTTPYAASAASTNVEVYRCPVTNVLGVNFKQVNATNTGTIADTVVLEGISLSAAYFIVDNTNTSMTLQFNLSTGSRTATFSMTRTSKSVSSACPANILLSDLALTATNFDTVGLKAVNISKDSLQDPPVINLEIIQ